MIKIRAEELFKEILFEVTSDCTEMLNAPWDLFDSAL